MAMNPTERLEKQLTAVHLAESLRKHRKVPLNMPADERHRLMDVLLRIHQIAMTTFDALEADAISESDVFVMLQLPEYCNTFTKGIEKHARERLGA